MHRIAGRSTAQMGEAGAGQMQMRRIRMVDRGQHPTVAQRGLQVDLGAEAMRGDRREQILASEDRFLSEIVG